MNRVPVFFLVWPLMINFGFCQAPSEYDNSIPIPKAREMLNAARVQWVLAEQKSIYVQGTIRHQSAGIVGGISTVNNEGVADWKHNKTGGVYKTRTTIPKEKSEVLVYNSLYFAMLESPGGSNRWDLIFLDWIKKGQDPPVSHSRWNLTKSIPDFARPYVYTTGAGNLIELVEHSDFEIKAAKLENGVLSIDFESYFEHPSNKGGVYDILGGRIELNESLKWFPQKVEINLGSSDRVIYSKTIMTLKYRDMASDDTYEMPLLERKTVSWKGVKQTPGSTSPPDYAVIQHTDMDLIVVDKLPADKEFRLSAFGLPEPVRPQSMSVTWWKWGGGMLVAGILFALIAVKLGRKK